MDKHYSEEFFANFLEGLQKVCRDYLQFSESVELSGYLALDIDNVKKERYVLCELLNGAGHVVSESHCTKVFKTIHKKPLQTSSYENIEIGAQKYVGLTVRNTRVSGSAKARPSPQRHTGKDSGSVSGLQVDVTMSDSVVRQRLSSSTKASLTSIPQSVEYSPSNHEQLTREDYFTDMSSTSLGLEKNTGKKRPVDDSEFTSVAKKSKSVIGNESTSLVTDMNILPINYEPEQSNVALSNQTIGSETDLHSVNEKIRLPLSVTIKQELVDENQSDSCVYSKSGDLNLTCETICSPTIGLDNNTQTFPDDTSLQPGTSDSKAFLDGKQEALGEDLQINFQRDRLMCMSQQSVPKPKNTRKMLDIETKYHIIHAVELGQKRKSVIAKEFGVLPNTLSTILKNKASVITAWETQHFRSKRFRLRRSDYVPIDDALYLWYQNAVCNNEYVNGPVLMAKANEIAQQIGFPQFQASAGFIERFRGRHGIRKNK